MSSEVKAVIFDIDGTAIRNEREALPSQRVIDAVQLGQRNGIHMCCATGRIPDVVRHITDRLQLVDPCIVSAGTQIIRPETGEELWSARMSEQAVDFALQALRPYDPVILVDGDTYETAQAATRIQAQPYRMLDVQYLKTSDVPAILTAPAAEPSLSAIPVDSHDPGLSFMHITDKQATKEHAVNKLLEILDIDMASVAGVGDGLNDLELFKSVGVKVAVGNARDELKQAADVIVPSVEEDGLAVYIEGLAS